MAIGSVASVTSSLTTATTDPRDTNGDGKVSAAEAQAYALKHPKAEATPAVATDKGAGALDVTV